MRDIVIKQILEFALEYGVTNLEAWFIKEITEQELDWLSDEELIEVLIHVATYDPDEV